jgi:hypothetical protein
MLLTDGTRRLDIDDADALRVYDGLWSDGLVMKGAVTAASKILYTLRVRASVRPREVEMSPDELDAVHAVLRNH